MFNWLGQDLTGMRCLDLFAGTGVMGFESLSRGASSVVMVENQREVVAALRENQQALQADKAIIVYSDALQFLASQNEPFDIIFCDPPYHQAWLDKCLPLLVRHLNPDGVVYAEAEIALQDTAQFSVIKHGRAGHVLYHLLKPR